MTRYGTNQAPEVERLVLFVEASAEQQGHPTEPLAEAPCRSRVNGMGGLRHFNGCEPGP